MIAYGMIRDAFPRLAPPQVQIYTNAFNQWFPVYGIINPRRVAAFIAQVGHESGGLRWTAEIWGPTDQQRRYEPPSTLAARLGNSEPGDGAWFKGRGLIQITGRSNYTQISRAFDIDFLSNPVLLESPNMAVRSACWWWSSRNLNEIADLDTVESFRRITRIINGGFNGWEDRLQRWESAKKIFAIPNDNSATVA